MYTDGKGGKPNDRAMFLHPSFWHNDKDAQRITEYELKGVSVPTYGTGAYSYDPNFPTPGAESKGRTLRRNTLAGLIGFQDLNLFFSRELINILVRECFQCCAGDPKVSKNLKPASDYIDGKELCPAVMTFVLETLQMPHDFMRIGDVCYCMVYIDPEAARQFVCSIHVNARRRWAESRQHHKPLNQETQRNSLHAPQFVPCSDVQRNNISIYDKNTREHNCQECPQVVRLLAYVIQTLIPKDMDRMNKEGNGET